MHLFTGLSLRRAPIILMLVVFVVLGGLYSMGRLKSELLPNIDLPVISVVSVYPGAAPDDVRRDVTEPIEKAIAGTANLKTLTSRSNDSVSFISAEYEYGTNTEKAQQTIQEAVNRLTLPTAVQRPTIGRFSFTDIPVIAYTVNTNDTGKDALVNLRRDLDEKLVPELKSIPGVNSVTVAGGGTRQVVITYNNAELVKKGVTASSINNSLVANNISFPAGEVVREGQSIPVRVVNQFASLDELRNFTVKAGSGLSSQGGGPPGGATGGVQGGPPSGATSGLTTGSQTAALPTPGVDVKLGEVANVDWSNDQGETISRSNGKPSLSLVIYKTQNANTVQVADRISERVNELKSTLPGSETVVLFDQSTFIKESLDGLTREGLLGAILAIVIILVFLFSIRSTIVTAVSIPLSVLMALILMNVFNISLNIMSLAGLAVAIGRVVDDSIVVLENIYRHHFQNGESLRDAAFNGTREVATAITASTITTVCVFLPLGFIAGLVSEFFRPFAIAVTFALMSSLLIALTVIPVLAVLLLKTGVAKRTTDDGRQTTSDVQANGKASEKAQPVISTETPSQRAGSRPSSVVRRPAAETWVQRIYTPAITWALKSRRTRLATMGLALLLFAGSMALTPFIGQTFLAFGSDKVLNVELTMKPGTDIATTSKASAAIEAKIRENPSVRNYQTTIGTNASQAASGFTALGSASVANLTVTLDRSVDIRAEADRMRDLVKANASSNAIEGYSVTPGSGGGPNSSAFSMVVSGSDYTDVVKTADKLTERLKGVGDLVNVNNDAARAKPQIRVKVDPSKAVEAGSSAIQIASQVRNLLTSQKVTEITVDGKSYDVQATYDKSLLSDPNAVAAVRVGNAIPVPLIALADVSIADGPVSITRINQERSVTVRGTINTDSTSGVTRAAQTIVDELKADAGNKPAAGTKISLAGVSQQQSESFGQLGVALIVAIALVYLVMVLTFGSLSTPFIIMFSLPLAAIGSIVALFVTGRPLGISALIGVLMLVGIVVTNAIVLLDLVEQLKHRGMSTHDALIEGGRTRVRPIIMTAIATMIALLPLVLGFSEGSIIAAELGTVVVGGLFTSTFLTLIVVPVAYSLLDSVRKRLGRRGGRDMEGESEEGGQHTNGVEHDTVRLPDMNPIEAAPAK